MAIPAIIDSTVVSAPPSLNNSAGSLYAILKAYADDLGFDVLFDTPAESALVLRARVGEDRFYYQVRDDSAFHPGTNNISAQLRAFEDMTAIDTGTGEFFTGWWPKHHTSGSRNYILASDGKTLHWYTRATAADFTYAFLGEAARFLFSDNRRSFVGMPFSAPTTNASSTASPFQYINTLIGANCRVSQNRAGAAAGVGVALVGHVNASTTNIFFSKNMAAAGGPSIASRVMIAASDEFPCGVIPGLLKPLNSSLSETPAVASGISTPSGIGSALEIPITFRIGTSFEPGSIFVDLGDWSAYDAQ